MEFHCTKKKVRWLAAILIAAAALLMTRVLLVQVYGGEESLYETAVWTEDCVSETEPSDFFVMRQEISCSADTLTGLAIALQPQIADPRGNLWIGLYDRSGELIWQTTEDARAFSEGETQTLQLELQVEPETPYDLVVSTRALGGGFDPLEALEENDTDCLVGTPPITESVMITVAPQKTVLSASRVFLAISLALTAFLMLVDLRIRWRAVRVIIYLIGVPGCLFACLSASEALNGNRFWLMEPKLIALNMLLAGLVFLFFLGLSTSMSFAVIATDLLILALCLANYYTMIFRQTPVNVSDVLAMFTALSVAGSYTYEITAEVVTVVSQFVLVCGFAVVFFRFRVYRKGLQKRRLIAGAVCIVIGVAGLNEISTRRFHEKAGTQTQLWDPKTSCGELGYPLYLSSSYAATRLEKPKGYTVSKVRDAAKQYISEDTEHTEELPNVIFIMNESLADFEADGVLKTDTPVLPYLHSLSESENAVTGSVVVPTFGAGTCNTEFEALTGASYLFGLSSNPYFLYSYNGMPSVAAAAGALGYRTTAVHIKDAANWSRNIGVPALGFDEFISEDNCKDYLPDEPLVVGWKATDTYSYDMVLDVMQRSEERDFVFCVTIQNHGGYEHEYRSEDPVQILEPQGGYPQAEEYLNLAHDSDWAFEALIAQLEESDEPTIVVMFGDHLPSIEETFLSQVLDPSDPFSRYETPVVFWANFDTDFAGLEDGFRMSSNYLSVFLMRSAGLPLTGWMQFLEELYEIYPVLSVIGTWTGDGEFVNSGMIRSSEPVILYEQFQYSLLTSQRGMESFFNLPASDADAG